MNPYPSSVIIRFFITEFAPVPKKDVFLSPDKGKGSDLPKKCTAYTEKDICEMEQKDSTQSVDKYRLMT